MLIFITTFRSISRNVRRVASPNIPNAFGSRSRSKTEASHEVDERIYKVISRKKYEDLPRSKSRVDGSSAPSLTPWNGGLKCTGSKNIIDNEEVNLSVEKRRPHADQQTEISPSTSLTEMSTDNLIGQSNPVSRKRGKKLASNSIESSSQSITKAKQGQQKGNKADKDVDKESARRRRRKKEDVEPQSSSIEPLYQPAMLIEDTLVDPPAKRQSSGREVEDSGKQIGEKIQLPQNQLAIVILENLSKFPHCILLTRVGNFYESYFDQATEVSRLLSIKLTKRTWHGQQVLMCGFPVIHMDRHLKSLVQVHKRCVALCEEFKRNLPEEGFDRRVVRVLTPGTLIDESFLNPYENNYLLSIHNSSLVNGLTLMGTKAAGIPSKYMLGLAWIDVSTGEFFSGTCTPESLKDELARITPREVVLHTGLGGCDSHPIRTALYEAGCFVSYILPNRGSKLVTTSSHADNVVDYLEERIHNIRLRTTEEDDAIELLTTFLQANLLEHMPSVSSMALQGLQNRMEIDSQTIKALEIKQEIREGGISGSLLSVVKRTVTTGGTRLLERWLCSPSTSIREIEARQNLVSIFLFIRYLRDDIVQQLKGLEDTSRIVQKFLLGRGDVSDLAAIKNAIETWNSIRSRIEREYEAEKARTSKMLEHEWKDLMALLGRMADLKCLAISIGMALQPMEHVNDSPPAGEFEQDVQPDAMMDNFSISGLQAKFSINPNFSSKLMSLHQRFSETQASRKRLEQELQRRYDVHSLTLRSSGKYGVHVHLGKGNREARKLQDSSQFVIIGSTSSSKMFFNQTWYLLGSDIIELTMQILTAERAAFEDLRNEVNNEATTLRRNARIMDELDVTIGFASLANEMKFVRPIVDDSQNYKVINGRHPTVELGLLNSGRTFTPNSVSLNSSSRLHIITGPNMAGKSTILRQTAILAILAQIGSFIPADAAQIGIVDKVFSRIGAKDDLFRDKSTFMVEMLETAEILKHATEKSLVIMDEVGRGTTVKDGLSIAFATVYHLYAYNRCRALFATHFHELADMLGYIEGDIPSGYFKCIGFFCTDVAETSDSYFTYSHRLRAGVNRDSHGLKVARLGGLPNPALEVAENTLNWLKDTESRWSPNASQLRHAGDLLANRSGYPI